MTGAAKFVTIEGLRKESPALSSRITSDGTFVSGKSRDADGK